MDFHPMFVQLQARFPGAGLLTELVQIHQNQFVVKAEIRAGGLVLVTAMASAATITEAEDQARLRALSVVGITTVASAAITPPISHAIVSPIPPAMAPTLAPVAMPFAKADAAFAPDAGLIAPSDRGTEPTEFEPTEFEPTGFEPMEFEPMGFDSMNLEPTDTEPTDIDIEPISDAAGSLYASEFDDSPHQDGFDAAPMLVSGAIAQKPTLEKPKPKKAGQALLEEIQATVPISPLTVSNSPPAASTKANPSSEAPEDLSSLIALTDVEMDRIGWGKQEGRDYLKQTYGKATRQRLDLEELLDFLNYLRALPSVNGL
jgi:hypothetical protein